MSRSNDNFLSRLLGIFDKEEPEQQQRSSDDVTELIYYIRNSGCHHIQESTQGLSDDDLAEIIESGNAETLIRAIDDGNSFGFMAASGDDDLMERLGYQWDGREWYHPDNE